MTSNHFALAALSALLVAGFQARAVTLCTAGNPNTTSVAETTPTSAFVNNNDGTLTHSLTGLMWKRCAQGLSGASCATGAATPMTWSAALAAAVADTTAGHSDWRLPNKKELESIVEFCGYSPAINQTLFPATPAWVFWSGSSYVPSPTSAWNVHFFYGFTFVYDKTYGLYVRLVRGGQSFGSFDANHPLQSTLDIDGNGTADALTDGLLVIRYLFGLRGASLIAGVLGPLATRTMAEIEAYIQSLLPP